MFIVIINTILASVTEVYYKKSLLLSDIKPTAFQFYSELLALPIIGLILLFSEFNYRLFVDFKVLLGFLFINLAYILYDNIAQKLYKVEKMAIIIPYFKINNFILIIAGYFFFRDSSLLSFAICLGALIMTLLFSFDFKNHEFPKNIWLLLSHQILKTAEVMLIAYFLKEISSLEYVVLYQITYLVVAFVIVVSARQLGEVKKVNWPTAKYRGISYVLGYGSFIIDAFLLKEYGLVMSVLFWFFGSGLSIGLAYLMFREIPEKKDIFLGVALVALVGLAFYFR